MRNIELTYLIQNVLQLLIINEHFHENESSLNFKYETLASFHFMKHVNNTVKYKLRELRQAIDTLLHSLLLSVQW